jgi:hypothetical protein
VSRAATSLAGRDGSACEEGREGFWLAAAIWDTLIRNFYSSPSEFHRQFDPVGLTGIPPLLLMRTSRIATLAPLVLILFPPCRICRCYSLSCLVCLTRPTGANKTLYSYKKQER